MEHYEILLSLIIIIIIQLGILVSLVFLCLTPIKTKILVKFTFLTLLFVTYNTIYQLKKIGVFGEDWAFIIFLVSLMVLLFYNAHFIAHILSKQQEKKITFRLILAACLVFPFVIFFSSFLRTKYFLEDTYSTLYMTFPVLLSAITTTLFFFYKGLSKKNQLRAVLSSGLLLATSLIFYLIQEKYNCTVHRAVVNLNFMVLAFFVVLVHKRSFMVKMYKGKRKTGIDADMVEYLKGYGLTNRQIEIAQQIIDGKTYAEIAENCHLALNTVTKHASNIFKKLGVSDKEDFLKKTN